MCLFQSCVILISSKSKKKLFGIALNGYIFLKKQVWIRSNSRWGKQTIHRKKQKECVQRHCTMILKNKTWNVIVATEVSLPQKTVRNLLNSGETTGSHLPFFLSRKEVSQANNKHCHWTPEASLDVSRKLKLKLSFQTGSCCLPQVCEWSAEILQVHLVACAVWIHVLWHPLTHTITQKRRNMCTRVLPLLFVVTSCPCENWQQNKHLCFWKILCCFFFLKKSVKCGHFAGVRFRLLFMRTTPHTPHLWKKKKKCLNASCNCAPLHQLGRNTHTVNYFYQKDKGRFELPGLTINKRNYLKTQLRPHPNQGIDVQIPALTIEGINLLDRKFTNKHIWKKLQR